MNNHTILVVDDTAQILRLTSDIFEIAGFKVLTAEDGEIALHILSETKIDLVVTDILMPNTDGYILCYTIRTTEKIKNVPVIIYSATYTSSSDEMMAMELGADKFIRKPASMKELIATAEYLLSDSRKYVYKIPTKPKSMEAARMYNEGLVHRLERRNFDLEEAKIKVEQGELRLKDAQSVARIGSWEIDIIQNVQYWSDELFDIFGITKKVIPSTELFLSFAHPDDFEQVSKNVEKAFQTLTDSSFDFQFIRRDGAIRHGYSK
jgi:two-component system cell cycle sensor histidine kinase/response regulator CckA